MNNKLHSTVSDCTSNDTDLYFLFAVWSTGQLLVNIED